MKEEEQNGRRQDIEEEEKEEKEQGIRYRWDRIGEWIRRKGGLELGLGLGGELRENRRRYMDYQEEKEWIVKVGKGEM